MKQQSKSVDKRLSPSPKRPDPRESKVKIAELAIQQFTESPSAFWESFPERANAIEHHLQSRRSAPKRVPVFDGYMTERERDFKLRSLTKIIKGYKESEIMTPEEARTALGLAAALRENAEPFKKTLLEILLRVIRLALGSERAERITFLKGKSVHHTYELARGITLSLAWDGALIKIELDAKEYQYRERALSFVGIAHDGRSDVARNHDKYLWTAPDEQ